MPLPDDDPLYDDPLYDDLEEDEDTYDDEQNAKAEARERRAQR